MGQDASIMSKSTGSNDFFNMHFIDICKYPNEFGGTSKVIYPDDMYEIRIVNCGL
jgi:hypothetical protein